MKNPVIIMICMFKVTHYCLQMYLKVFVTTLSNIWAWSSLLFCRNRISNAGVSQKKGDKLELLTDINMLLTLEKGIRSGICHAIYQYSTQNNKYINNCWKDSSCLMHWDANNLCGWAMYQKLPVNSFKWKKKQNKTKKTPKKTDTHQSLFKIL